MASEDVDWEGTAKASRASDGQTDFLGLEH
jgi:hypothetical protein